MIGRRSFPFWGIQPILRGYLSLVVEEGNHQTPTKTAGKTKTNVNPKGLTSNTAWCGLPGKYLAKKLGLIPSFPILQYQEPNKGFNKNTVSAEVSPFKSHIFGMFQLPLVVRLHLESPTIIYIQYTGCIPVQ